MRLVLIAPENVYEHEVDASMEVQDLQALVEAETGMSISDVKMTIDSGVELSAKDKSLASFGLQGDTATIFLTFRPKQPVASSSSGRSRTMPYGSGGSGGGSGFPESDEDLEGMRLQALANTDFMAELRRRDPALAQAFESGDRFREEYMRYQRQYREAQAEKQRQIALLNADPYDIEAQKRIEEAIRQEAVLENMQHALEWSPEAFGRVTMLYIDTEVNGHPVKAFVDSGAQSTIISPECAEACGIMRLLDTRYEGTAHGVGQAKIYGRIHSAQIKLGNLFLPCSFSVMEGKAVDLLFGLDMLKAHQCCIDLAANVLRIQDTIVPFLAEHELPDKAKQDGTEQLAEDMEKAAAQGISPVATTRNDASAGPSSFPGTGSALGGAGPSTSAPAGATARGQAPTSRAPASGGGLNSQAEQDIQTLMGLGAERQQAIQLLESAGGNVDIAASMLFGGGAQWP